MTSTGNAINCLRWYKLYYYTGNAHAVMRCVTGPNTMDDKTGNTGIAQVSIVN